MIPSAQTRINVSLAGKPYNAPKWLADQAPHLGKKAPTDPEPTFDAERWGYTFTLRWPSHGDRIRVDADARKLARERYGIELGDLGLSSVQVVMAAVYLSLLTVAAKGTPLPEWATLEGPSEPESLLALVRVVELAEEEFAAQKKSSETVG